MTGIQLIVIYVVTALQGVAVIQRCLRLCYELRYPNTGIVSVTSTYAYH